MSKVFIPESTFGKSSKKKKKRINRCAFKTCTRKLYLTDAVCRCQHIYCTLHRLPETHACNYNFKTETKAAFMKRVGLGGGEVRKLEVI